jgi:radical SAM protein, TatD family-associated
MRDTYIYRLGEAIYINLTNRCTNDCTFCVRNNSDGVGGYHLYLQKEPSAQDVIALLEKEENVAEIVFCGLGEPTMRLDALLETAAYLKTRGSHIRINTNGQGGAYAGEDIAPRLRGLIDIVSVSLNASGAQQYDRLCRSAYGEEAYAHLLDFAKSCVAQGIDTVLSVVDVIGGDEIEKCRSIAEGIGARLRVRHYIA